MRILFISKGHPIEPLGIMYLSSALKAAGHKTKLTLIEQDYEEIVEKYKPDIIAYSVMWGEHKLYLELNRKLKKKYKFISIMGGAYPTFYPQILEEDDALDIICQGEGEITFVELVDRIENNKDITTVKNLWIRNNGKIYKNPLRPLIDNIDEIKFPDRELVMEHIIWQENQIKHFMTTRGCPYNCSYCFNHAYYKLYGRESRKIRYRSVKNVIEEIEDVRLKCPIRMVYFQDDIFGLSKKWLEEFSIRYKQIGLPFHCHLRADLLDEESIRLLKEANCYSVHLGIETGNDYLRRKILKRNISKEEMFKVITLLKKNKIKVMSQNMVGLPMGDLKTDLETLRFNIKCKPTYSWVSIFQPYPGTELANFCTEKNLIKTDFNCIEENFFDTSILNIKDKRKIEHLQKWFAITCGFPSMYYTGFIYFLINIPGFKFIRSFYKWIYTYYRKKKDRELYVM